MQRLEYGDIFLIMEHSLYISIHKALFYVNSISLLDINAECVRFHFENSLKEFLSQAPSVKMPRDKKVDDYIRLYFDKK